METSLNELQVISFYFLPIFSLLSSCVQPWKKGAAAAELPDNDRNFKLILHKE